MLFDWVWLEIIIQGECPEHGGYLIYSSIVCQLVGYLLGKHTASKVFLLSGIEKTC